MIRKISFLLVMMVSLPIFAKVGMNKDFWIISQKDYDIRISKGKDVVLKRYIVVPNMDKNYKSISDTDSDFLILSKFSYMLKKNKSSNLEYYINICDAHKQINLLVNGLYYLSEKKYSKAIEFLNQYESSEYEFLKYLLIADCKYELLTIKRDYKNIIKDYQIALDIANDDKTKALVNNRIKFIKYR